MGESKKIEVIESILNCNDRIAKETNETLTSAGVFTINVMGAPGAGKTSTIKSIINGLKGIKSYVIEGDIESDLDTMSLRAHGINTVQINTHGACHLDAPVISETINKWGLDKPGVLFIENIGNLVCPAEFTIGEHIKMLIATVTEGSDKPYKYPLAFEKADVIIINKADLMPYVDFNEKFFMTGVRALNPNGLVVKVSANDSESIEEVVQWIKERYFNING